ncbi:MAG TPA: NUDIX domain-containing protein [Candidatus Saccharimonadales bacterium]|jgi:8-oxo-dGTP pyrophosphatase MutT (NUDIX family)|nr:NUDIX domain-containing protein [Candidatus Saccharimonadales bacterium]
MTFREPEHHIQKEIVRRLMYAVSLRFSELKPDGLESNIFMYHLKQLMAAGAVEKSDGAYRLTTEGLRYVDRFSASRGRLREQPKIISLLRMQDAEGSSLLWRRAKQPFIDRVDAVQGKLHVGESLLEAATRELAEKTGLQDVPLAYRGGVLITYKQNDVLLSQVLAHIYEGAAIAPQPELTTEASGRAFWGDPDAESDLMPAYSYITKLLQTHEYPFLEEATFAL